MQKNYYKSKRMSFFTFAKIAYFVLVNTAGYKFIICLARFKKIFHILQSFYEQCRRRGGGISCYFKISIAISICVPYIC